MQNGFTNPLAYKGFPLNGRFVHRNDTCISVPRPDPCTHPHCLYDSHTKQNNIDAWYVHHFYISDCLLDVLYSSFTFLKYKILNKLLRDTTKTLQSSIVSWLDSAIKKLPPDFTIPCFLFSDILINP